MAKAVALKSVDAHVLKHWMEAGEAVLVDVREPSMHAAERIPGAKLVPLSAWGKAALPDVQDKRLVLHCEIGVMSQDAARRLLANGYPEVYHLHGGISAWKLAGYPIQGDADAPLPVPRQMQLVAGTTVLAGTLLGALVSPWFLALSGFVGAGLVFAGATGRCGLTAVLLKLPYNRRAYRGG